MRVSVDIMADENIHPQIKFDQFDLPFRQYLAAVRQTLTQFYLSHFNTINPQRIDANSPFEWNATLANGNSPKRGVLLTHGLLDSPYSLRAVGKIFSDNDFLVRSVLLPGHGTSPENLLTVNYQDWVNCVEYAIKTLQQDVDEVYLVGFSAGSSLSLIHAHLMQNIKGLILLSPAFKIRSKLIQLSKTMHRMRIINKNLGWHNLTSETDYAKYRSVSYNMAHNAYALSQLNQRIAEQHSLNCPMLLAISDADETVAYQPAIDFFLKSRNPKSRCILYSKHPQHQFPLDPRLIIRSSVYPEYNVVDYSHVCIPLSINDPHYGPNGDYVPMLHLPKHHPRAQAIRNNDIMFGALSHQNLKKYPLRRLTFNPDFDFLRQQIQHFIDLNE